MGTSGYRIVRFRGRHYCFYRHFDSYPSGLGRWIVAKIPQDPGKYTEWLAAQRALFAEWEALLHDMLSLSLHDDRIVYIDHQASPRIWEQPSPAWHDLDETLPEEFPPNYVPGFSDGCSIEWTYTLDLDAEVFTVDNGAHIKLDRIPREHWEDALALDGYGHRYLVPDMVPKDSVAHVVVRLDNPESSLLECYDALKIATVKAKGQNDFPRSQRASWRIRAEIFRSFCTAQRQIISYLLLSWNATDVPFREVAYAILCVAHGGSYLQMLNTRRVGGDSNHGYFTYVAGSDPDGEPEIITDLFSGYHCKNFPVGSSPPGNMYWFEGVLISLVPQLQRADAIRAAVVEAYNYGREGCHRSAFNGIILSIEHVVLLKVYADGHLDVTELMTLFDIPYHYTRDPESRYGKLDCDKMCAAFVREHEKGLAREELAREKKASAEGAPCDEEVSDDGEKPDDNEEPDDEEVSDNGEEPDDKEKPDDEEKLDDGEEPNVGEELSEDLCLTDETFAALMHLFEAAGKEGLPSSTTLPNMPSEVIRMIISHVGELDTFNNLSRVSRAFRSMCQERAMFMDDVAFAIEDTSQNDQPKSETLYAVNKTTGKKSEVNFSAHGQSREQRDRRIAPELSMWYVVVGDQHHRRTFVKVRIWLHGVGIPEPWTVPKRKLLTPEDWLIPIPSNDENDSDPHRFQWRGVLGYPLSSRSSSDQTFQFWSNAIRQVLYSQFQNFSTSAEHLPSNTAERFESIDASNKEHFEAHNIICLRTKRSVRDREHAWHDMIGETEERLKTTPRIRGFGYPPVRRIQGRVFTILAIGQSARWFIWEDDLINGEPFDPKKQTGRLVEWRAGKIFSVMVQEDSIAFQDFGAEAKEWLKFVKGKTEA